MTDRIQIIRHEVVPKCGSYEVRFPDGRPSKYFYYEDIPSRRLKSDQADSFQALKDAGLSRGPREIAPSNQKLSAKRCLGGQYPAHDYECADDLI